MKIQISGGQKLIENYMAAVANAGAEPVAAYCPQPDLSCDGLLLCGGGICAGRCGSGLCWILCAGSLCGGAAGGRACFRRRQEFCNLVLFALLAVLV